MRLYADYLHAEYGDLDSDYVFVNLWGAPARAAVDLCRGLRPGAAAAPPTGVDFDPHWIRHTAATRLLRDGIGLEVVAHAARPLHVAVTTATYGHLTVEDARRGMEQVGWFTGGQVQL